MPAVARSAQDRIDIGAFEQLAKIAVGYTIISSVIFIDYGFGLTAPVFSDITDSNKLHIRTCHKVLHITGTLTAESDSSHYDSFAGRD